MTNNKLLIHLREKDKSEILSIKQRILPEITMWAYGSRVNGKCHEGSDLDLVLRSPDLNKIDNDKLIQFETALNNSNIPIIVEARDWARLPKAFHQEIERNYTPLDI